MASTFTPNKNFEEPAFNDYVNNWQTPLNANLTLIDTALGGSAALNAGGLSGNQTLTTAQYQPLTLLITGAPSAAITYVVPSGVGGFWIVSNGTTGGQTVGVKSNAGGATITIPAGTATIVSCDGSASGMRLAISTAPSAAGSNTQVQYNASGLLGASTNLTFDGTTLSATGLNIAGNVTLGSGAGSTLTLNGSTVSIPNTLTIGASNLLYLNSATGQVAIGTGTPTAGASLTVAGTIKITSGGLTFSDGSQLVSAANIAPGGASGNLQFNSSGTFGGDATLTFNSATKVLSMQTASPTTLVYGGVTLASTITGTGSLVASVSPVLTGTPTAPTQTALDNSTKLATTAYTDGAVSTATAGGKVLATVSFNNAGTIAGTKHNVASVTKNSTGNWTVTYTTAVQAGAAPFVQLVDGAQSGPVIVTSDGTASFTFQAYSLAGAATEFAGYRVSVTG